MDRLLATKSEGAGLIVRAVSFQDFQPMWSQITNVTDGQTDGQTTCDGKTALCTMQLSASFCSITLIYGHLPIVKAEAPPLSFGTDRCSLIWRKIISCRSDATKSRSDAINAKVGQLRVGHMRVGHLRPSPENVIMGSISVNPHFTIYCSIQNLQPKPAVDDNVQSEFSCDFLNTIFACLPPLASAARCGPHPPHPPRYATEA